MHEDEGEVRSQTLEKEIIKINVQGTLELTGVGLWLVNAMGAFIPCTLAASDTRRF